MGSSRSGIAAAIAFLAAGLYLLTAILSTLFMTDGGSFSLLGITAAPLVAAFSYASLYIPLYLLFGGVLILSPVSPRRWIPALSMTALPFLSLSFFFRILSGMGYTPVMARVVQAFGYRGSLVSLGILSLFFSMLAVLAGIRLGRLPRPAATPGSSGDARMLPAEIVPVDGCYSGIVESGAGRPAAGSSSAGAAAVSSPAGWTEAVPTSSADDAAPAAPVPFADDAAAKPFPSSDSFAAGVPLRKSPESVAGEPQFTFIMPKIPEPPALSSMAPMRTLSPAAMADLSTPTVLRMEAGRKPAEDSPADVVESIDVGTADEMGGGAAVEPALPNEEEEVWPELPEEAEELGEAFESEEVEIDDLDADEEFPEFEDAEPLREKVDADPEETLVEAEPPAAEIGAEIAAGQPSGAVSPAATRKNGDVTRPSALEKDGGKSIPAPAQRDPKRGSRKYAVPVAPLLNDYPDGQYWVVDDDTRRAADILKETLEEFGIQAEVTGIRKGPVITMFEILPAPGVKLSKIVNLADNIALRLAASRVRIVAPIPGKHAVGIEVPNKHRAIVSFRELIDSDLFNTAKMEIPVILGKDITGEAQVIDLVQTPHLLIAGATGSGKSVCVNSIICTILYKRKPEEVRMILIDPKIVELKLYNDIPHLLTPVIMSRKGPSRPSSTASTRWSADTRSSTPSGCGTSGRTTGRSEPRTWPPFHFHTSSSSSTSSRTSWPQRERSWRRPLPAWQPCRAPSESTSFWLPSVPPSTSSRGSSRRTSLHASPSWWRANSTPGSSSTRSARKSSSAGGICCSPRPGIRSRYASRAPISPRRRWNGYPIT